MGQQEVYDLLKKHKERWFGAREITELLTTSFNNVTCNLKRLREAGVIMYKKVIRVVEPAGKKPIYVYKYIK